MATGGRQAALWFLSTFLATAAAFKIKECYPDWYDPDSNESQNDQCPYGKLLPGSVTWQDDMNPWLRALNIWYGYTAFWCPIYVGITAVIVRGSREVLYCAAIVVLSLWNEFVLKNLIRDPKPEHQCAITCGMPSGHAAIAVTMFTMYALDNAARVDFKAPCTCASMTRSLLLIEVGRINATVYLAVVMLWGVLLLPVPISRVLNFDHTWEQCLWGAIEGFFWALTTYWLYWVIAFTCGWPFKYPSGNPDGCFKDGACDGEGCGYLFRHNITAPYWTKAGAQQEPALLWNEDDWGCALESDDDD
mmetsp:Transcript_22758/g.51939  ORF Transcript_22758/g.51939 Transcript_22758/m.51939 type:complete len:304 (-) Transcript_22758:34-945(-)